MELKDFRAMRVSLASPDTIRAWSYGEVQKPETINYRTLRPERDGLFDERIFGPQRDWECACGKYKKIRNRGITCDKCGVQVAPARVRRERMGHIELASPVSHLWYVRGVPSRIGLILDLSPRALERVLYFAQYIVMKVDEDARKRMMQRLSKETQNKAAELELKVAEEIEELEQQSDKEIDALTRKTETATAKIEEQLAETTDQIVSIAKKLENRIEEARGSEIRKAIVFEPTDEVIATEGETVAAKHRKRLNELVQAHLADIEKEFREKESDKQLMLDAEKEQKKQALNDASAKLRQKLDAQLEKIHAAHDEKMDELKAIRVGEIINEARYNEMRDKWGTLFAAAMGAEAIYEILKGVDLDHLSQTLRATIRATKSKQVKKKEIKRLRVVEALRRAENRPEWMMLTVLPVIPPDLRPMVQLDGGRFATSDLNDLYRRVINRNNRLRRLLELSAPEVIVNNEKRMLQESVDSLIDNSSRGKAVSARGQRKLKSLSDLLKGKQGRFRRNLLGKRVDYSGRSVIVVGPHLKLHQCGLPKGMALELFKPFVMRKLVEYNYAHNIKSAKRLVDRSSSEVWDVLEEIIKHHPVLLNRAPTLHRLGIQAFEVILVEGSAIQIHPLVCAAFNADFDGDMMAVHVPLSEAAKDEARKLMLSSRNLLKPASGEPIVEPTKDMVLGVYYLTMDKPGARGEGKVFYSSDEVALAHDLGHVELHAKIKLAHNPETYHRAPKGARRKGDLFETTVGRVLFNEILPPQVRFSNDALDKKGLKELVAEVYNQMGAEGTAHVVDQIKEVGFKYATRSGLTIAIDDITVPSEKQTILDRITAKVHEVEQQFRRGLITEEEQYVKTVEYWTEATELVTQAVAKGMREASPILVYAKSGAVKGGFQPIRQLAGMRGLMADPAGRIIALPIKSNFREGLSALEYFISTHGARKGLADTALRTADAGYLTRRLVDVAQEVIITEEDCGTSAGMWLDTHSKERTGGTFAERVSGRIAAAPITDPKTGEVIIAAGEMITEDNWTSVEKAKVERVYARSPLTCDARHGLCAKCYGRDLARGGLIPIGEAVGIIAAQSIGEPGTQLTLRTFHTGGVAGVEDITSGLPRVEELFEARDPKGEALMAELDGVVQIYNDGDERKLRIANVRVEQDEYTLPRGTKALIEEGDEVEAGQVLTKGGEAIIAKAAGRAIVEKGLITIRRELQTEAIAEVPATARLRVEDGQTVKAGDQLTDGPKNPREILRILGKEACELYLLEEVQGVYRSQGVNIHDKHIEIIVSQMLRRVRVRSSGDTDLLPGEILDRKAFNERNSKATAIGGNPSTAQPILLGLTRSALATESFLAAASFQETSRVLTDAAVRGRVDQLRGLKENVILGKLIPVGSGFHPETAPLDIGPVPTVTVDDISEEPEFAG
ncbi:MAG: DNA-directed RNA polymerase subunit beta' [Chloroflexi bacterium]|nr:DNA-directed RNA polymerase subunit beta' [Chloroflexota bacterium]